MTIELNPDSELARLLRRRIEEAYWRRVLGEGPSRAQGLQHVIDAHPTLCVQP